MSRAPVKVILQDQPFEPLELEPTVGLRARWGLWAASLVGCVFAVHPLHVQSVAWISQRPMLLGTALLLSSLTVYLRLSGLNPMPINEQPQKLLQLPQSKRALYVLSLQLFILAVLAHPAMAVMP